MAAASAQEAEPLITVRQGPVLPPAAEPPVPAELVPLPALYSEPVGPFTMYMEVIASGPGETGLFTSPGCILDGVFKRGMKLVWRFEVYDMANGLRVTDRDGSQAQITLPDGDVIPARFDQRGGAAAAPDSPWTWVAVWYIPEDYPLGPVDYNVTVTTPDGRTSTMQPAMGVRYPQIVD
jgi:hypothetical protein